MSKKILIVDDASFMRLMLKRILTKGGYEVVGEADNGACALDKYVECKPDLTILDITMPEKSGVEALKDIMKFNPNALCIMCSAMGQQAIVVDAIRQGAKDFIVKPFKEETVLKSINNIFTKYT